MKKPTLSSLKKKVDTVFSRWVRARGSREGQNTCVSCGAIHPIGDLQAGHYYRRQHLGTRWDERNVWPQCFACNVWRRGNYASYAKFMYSTYSQEVMDELDELHKRPIKLSRQDLEDLITKYS